MNYDDWKATDDTDRGPACARCNNNGAGPNGLCSSCDRDYQAEIAEEENEELERQSQAGESDREAREERLDEKGAWDDD